MTTNSSTSLPPAKAPILPQIPSPSQAQAPASFHPDNNQPQRRNGREGNFGPRNNQSSRRHHKEQRRPKLANDEAMAESTAIRAPSSRKGQTSITHLMNFALPPRPQNHFHSHHNQRARRNPTWGLGSGYHADDKARYIHANYRFIVDPMGDYRSQAADPDVHLNWNDVLQILASAQSQSASCPICLSTPVAPRMAKCGHIFCLPCLIRYMFSAEDTNPIPEKKARWKKCPICWDSVYMTETRPVRWFVGQEGEPPQEGGDIVLRLMARAVGSILALPKDCSTHGAGTGDEDIPWYNTAEVTDYARIMKGGEDYMRAHFDREIEDILLQEREDEVMFGEETQWTKKAVYAIKEAKEKLQGLGNPPEAPQRQLEEADPRPPIQYNQDVPDFYAIGQAARSGQCASTQFPPDHLPIIDAKSLPIRGISMKSGVQHRDTPFFFYQSLLHYYLSPLDIRILRAAFRDYPTFPSTILPRIEHVSTGHIVDDDLRKRAKYLGHLPHGCEVAFLECNWIGVVSSEVLKSFSGEIERRRKRNREKEVREEKERIRAEREEDDKRWAQARRKRPSISRDKDFLPEPTPSLNGSIESVSAADLSMPSSSPPWLSKRTGSAFASLASPSTSPDAPRTVWGTAAVASASPTLAAMALPESSENDGWLQDWERDLHEEADLVNQMNAASIRGSNAGAGAAGSTGQKKKKKQKITLMSTNARRAA